VNPYKEKHWDFYMAVAHLAAMKSECINKKVGTVVVTSEGLLATGWNGTSAGLDNCCEANGKSKPTVVHAEENAIYKLLRQGISSKGTYLFTTTSPCIICAKLIIESGIKHVIFDELHDDLTGLNYLKSCNINIYQLR